MAAHDTVTITMTERVSYESTLTHGQLADMLGIDVDYVPALLADTSRWSATYGPGGSDNSAVLEVIDQAECWDSAEDRQWSMR
jgi:hypothetical protein